MDPSGNHKSNRRSGENHPYSGAYGRDHQQTDPCIQTAYCRSLGREPTPEEIAEEMNMPVERVREILKISQEPVSLETPIGEEEDSHLGDFIQDDNVPVPADAAAFTLLKEQLVEVLGHLDRKRAESAYAFVLDWMTEEQEHWRKSEKNSMLPVSVSVRSRQRHLENSVTQAEAEN